MTKFVVPDEESLKIESDGRICDLEGCGKVFQGSSQLHMHQLKHHQGKQLSAKSGTTKYFCPVSNCDRSKESGRPFSRLGQLKQHYQRIHGVKEFLCEKCGKAFPLRDTYRRHQSECGKDFLCKTCGETFKTKNSQYKHAQRRGHTLPESSKPRVKKKTLPPVIIKQVMRLPNKLVSTSTQTQEEGLGETANRGESLVEISSGCPENLRSILFDLSTQTELCPSLSHLNLSTQTETNFDFSTQTELCPSLSSLDLSTQTPSFSQFNLSTQTDMNSNFDFSTQTEGRSNFDLSTQTELGSNFDLSTQTKSSLDLSTQTEMSSSLGQFDFSTQTEACSDHMDLDLSVRSSDLVQFDFSTQTDSCSSFGFDFSDLATQTELSELFDLGTQTTAPVGLCQSARQTSLCTPLTACQTCQSTPGGPSCSCQENLSHSTSAGPSSDLCLHLPHLNSSEFGTQTVIEGTLQPTSSDNFYAQLGRFPSVEFGTQTLFSPKNQSHFTQTCFDDLYGLASRTDFGTQTATGELHSPALLSPVSSQTPTAREEGEG